MSDYTAWRRNRDRQRWPRTSASYQMVQGLPHPRSPGEQALFAAQQVDGRLLNVHFNRSVGPFIPDLVHFRSRVVVEIDGFTYHEADPKRAEDDKERDRDLLKRGYQVLRFSGREATEETARVVDEIEAAIARASAAQEEARRAVRVVREQEHAEKPRTQVTRLVMQIAKAHDLRNGYGSGAKIAKRLNRELMNRFGPAADRSDETQREALDWLDLVWAEYRAKHGIPASAVPAHDADVRPRCLECGQLADAPDVMGVFHCVEHNPAGTCDRCDEHDVLLFDDGASCDLRVCRDCFGGEVCQVCDEAPAGGLLGLDICQCGQCMDEHDQWVLLCDRCWDIRYNPDEETA